MILLRHLQKRTAIAVLMAAPFTATAFGQHEVTGAEFVIDADSIDAMDLVSRRDREAIHPGNPLEIMGLGQADNDFRKGLHAAKRGSYLPAQVESREMYERQLAMYGGDARFDRAPRTLATPDGAPVTAGPGAVEKDSPEPKPYDTTWIGMVIAAAASLGAFLSRGRGAPTP